MVASSADPSDERLSRIRLLLGDDKLTRLCKAKVTVVGLGAVGAQATEALARSGVGHFRLIDFDIIRSSNINRHIWAFRSTVGRPKTEVGRDRLWDIDPAIELDIRPTFVSAETLPDIIMGTDVVIDAIDSLSPKIQLLAACVRQGVTVISSMGAATRTDPSAIKVADLFDTRHCPLATRLRRGLKDLGIGRGITAVYSEEVRHIKAVAAIVNRDPGEFQRGRPRRAMGSLPSLTGIFGLTLANTVISHLCGGLRGHCRI